MIDLSNLNFEQKDALLQSFGPSDKICILAGAGSGKTRVITNRIAYMIDDLGISSSKIMCMTFTNKAATEMKDRLQKMNVNSHQIWMGTFHSVCVRLLKTYGKSIGIGTFTILDPDDQMSLIKKIVKDLSLKIERDEYYKSAQRISSCKSTLKNPAYMRTIISNSFDSEFVQLYEEYQRRTWSSKMFDYDDLIVYTYLLLNKNADVKQKFQDRFPYVIVDEFQDTNDVQFRLLAEMTGQNNLFVVGDDWQSIYGFRAAKPQYIIDFHKYFPGAKIKKFQLNYRSTSTLVEASNSLIKTNLNRTDKHMVAASSVTGQPIHTHKAISSEEEAKFIARYILYLKAFNVEFKEIAILYRSHFQSRLIEQNLMALKVPYVIIGSISFYDRKEVKDMLAYLKLYVNPRDEMAYRRVLGLIFNVGQVTIDALVLDARNKGLEFLDHLAQYGHTSKNAALKAFKDKILMIFDSFRTTMATPVEAIQMVLHETNYLQMAQNSTQYGEMVIENINELMNSAVEFASTNVSISAQDTIRDFIDQLLLTTSIEQLDGSVDVVNLMTIHASKGLEFKAVICCGWSEGLLPHKNSLGSEDSVEEERRLAYVGISRAEQYLLITQAKTTTDYSKNKVDLSQSRFLRNIPNHLLKEI